MIGMFVDMKNANNILPKRNDGLDSGPEAYAAVLQPGNKYAYLIAGGQPVAGSACFVAELTRQPVRRGDRMEESLIFYNYDVQDGRCTGNGPASFRLGLEENGRRAELLISAQLSGINVARFSRATTFFIEKIEETRVCDWLCYGITFTCPVQIAVSELSGPGRIVLNIIRQGAMPVCFV